MTDPEELRARAASIFHQMRTVEHEAEATDSSAVERGGASEEVAAASGGAAAVPAVDDADQLSPAAERAAQRPPVGLGDRPILDPEGASDLDQLIATAAATAATTTGPGPSPHPAPAPSAPEPSASAPAPLQNGPMSPLAPPRIDAPPDAPDAPDVADDHTSSPPPDTDPAVDLTSPEVPAATSPASAGDTSDTPTHPVLPPTTTRAPHPGAGRPLPRLMAIANQKGGVGKTTTAVNLGASLAELGYRVLVVDLDPQGNATTGLGINARSLESSVYDVILHDVPAEDVIEPTALRNLFVMPATIDLAGAEIELVPVFSRELRLKRALETVHDDYDYVLIDCPPSLGLLTINGLAAATEVAVPIQCEYYALEGLGQLLRNVTMVQANLNAALDLSTIILTMYDARTRLAEQVVSEVREHFGDRVCRNVVPRTVRLSEAPSFGQPIIVFDSSSRGSIAYRELAKEVSGGASKRVG